MGVVEDSMQANGDIIRRMDMENHVSGFVSLVISFLAFVFAVTKAFPRTGRPNSRLLVHLCSKMLLEFELMPNYVLELLRDGIDKLIEHRKNNDIDGQFGEGVSPQWKMFFDNEADNTVPSIDVEKQEDVCI